MILNRLNVTLSLLTVIIASCNAQTDTSATSDWEHMLKDTAVVIDVRTPGEFEQGHADGSINIPVSEIGDRVEEIRSMGRPVVLCCRTGNRSGQAMKLLSEEGIDCANAGSWQSVQQVLED